MVFPLFVLTSYFHMHYIPLQRQISNIGVSSGGMPDRQIISLLIYNPAVCRRTGLDSYKSSLIAMFMGPTWGPSGTDRTKVGPMLAPRTLLSGLLS